MSTKSTLDDFLDILRDSTEEAPAIKLNGRSISLRPLNFKQQKALITTGLDGLVGVIGFILQLNKTIQDCTDETNLKIIDRVPIVLHLRKLLTDKPIVSDDKSVSVDDLIKNIVDYDGLEEAQITTDQYLINLAIPSLTRENKFLSACVDELKPLQEGGLGENISAILAYEIPKFITSIEFGERTIDFDAINLKEKIKIANALPASVTSQISEFISKISSYDEKLLTFDDVVVELDSSFFE